MEKTGDPPYSRLVDYRFCYLISVTFRAVTLRSVHDPNRRRLVGMIHQFLTLFAIAMVILFVLASDLKSVATYFGLLSAGLLLALEYVILATLGSLLLVGERELDLATVYRFPGLLAMSSIWACCNFRCENSTYRSSASHGHVATFSNSLFFVSPATGLIPGSVLLQKEPGKMSKQQRNGGAGRWGAFWLRVTRVRGLAPGAEHRDRNVILLSFGLLSSY